ncbi:hypothetical protein NA57DRAFT_61131 [Rhizodiscina lignyota]|uniref:DUF7708 domain-containing protein n=1 Tax=Rhizodiscina lignyota TaxID=1504668 RepID=A0A9P4I723_9PEZI|nr:hypothetical protein NA57DRAFT_61131 [Rhizodiscina lignyota]
MQNPQTSIVRSTVADFDVEGSLALERQLSLYQSNSDITAWHTNSQGTRWDDPAREAYQEAVALFKRELTHDECKRIWLDDKASMYDVQLAIVHAQAEYEKSSKKSKAKIWLARCSSTIMHYGNVLDVLVQQSPEYVSLIWGAMKFLFTAVLNHEELLAEVSKAVSRIADVLPRAELHINLYPTPRMKEAIAVLYAKIIKFVQSAISYYKKDRISKSFTAVVKPFALSFKGAVEEITECSKRVDELANSASKAELRDLRVETRTLRAEVQDLRFQVREMAMIQHTFQNQVFLNMSSQRHNYETLQMDNIRALPMIEHVPSAEQSLQYCRSMTRRRRVRLKTSLSARDIQWLKTWITNKESSILIGEARGIKTSSRDFAGDLLEALISAEIPVIWFLPSSLDEDDVTAEKVFISLIMQTINLNPGILSEQVNPVSATHFKTVRTTDEWFTMFQRCLREIQQLYIVLDLILISKLLKKDSSMELDELLEKLEELSERHTGIIKVVLLSWRSDATLSGLSERSVDTHILATDPGPRKIRLMRNPKFRAAFSARGRSVSDALKTSA